MRDMEIEMFGQELNADELLGELDDIEAAQASKEIGDLEPQPIIISKPQIAKQEEEEEEEEVPVAAKPKR